MKMTTYQKHIPALLLISILTIVPGLWGCSKSSEEHNTPAAVEENTTAAPAAETNNGRIAQLQREADNGDPDAQYNLAYMYENGLDVPKDEAKAIELYEKAAYQGHEAAKNNLNVLKNR